MVLSEKEAFNIIRNAANWLQDNYSKYRNIDTVNLVNAGLAIAKLESHYRTDAKNSTTTAMGMMQILAGTQTDIEDRLLKIPRKPRSEMYNPDYAAKLGIGYLADKYVKYKDWKKAAVAYNQGHYNPSSAGNEYLDKWQRVYSRIEYINLWNPVKPDYVHEDLLSLPEDKGGGAYPYIVGILLIGAAYGVYWKVRQG